MCRGWSGRSEKLRAPRSPPRAPRARRPTSARARCRGREERRLRHGLPRGRRLQLGRPRPGRRLRRDRLELLRRHARVERLRVEAALARHPARSPAIGGDTGRPPPGGLHPEAREGARAGGRHPVGRAAASNAASSATKRRLGQKLLLRREIVVEIQLPSRFSFADAAQAGAIQSSPRAIADELARCVATTPAATPAGTRGCASASP